MFFQKALLKNTLECLKCDFDEAIDTHEITIDEIENAKFTKIVGQRTQASNVSFCVHSKYIIKPKH
jgi:hypothetical protein